MTTPTPALTALLDELDRLRAAATPGQWRAEANYRRLDGCRCLSCYEDTPRWWDVDPVDGPDCDDHGCYHAIRIGEPDAALIVAAVNAVPRLTAAVRAALAFADELETLGVVMGSREAADLRSALAATLEVKP